MFLCKQIDEYKRKRRRGGFTPGHQGLLYRVELNDQGRPIWVLHDPRVWWCAGYVDGERKVKRVLDSRYPNLPWIASAAHRKLVTMTEASKLMVDRIKNGAPKGMALDLLTELVSEQPKPEPEQLTA